MHVLQWRRWTECCWPLPAQSSLGPSPLGLANIFYCLRFGTSGFVASYNSQGHSGGIRPSLHMGMNCYQSQSHIATDGQSVSKSCCWAPSGAHDQIFFTVWHLRSCFCRVPSLMRGRVSLLYMLLAPASAVFLGSESLGTQDHILLSHELLSSQSHIATDGQSVSQSVCLGVEPHLGLMTSDERAGLSSVRVIACIGSLRRRTLRSALLS
jgi:hypothetical protein